MKPPQSPHIEETSSALRKKEIWQEKCCTWYERQNGKVIEIARPADNRIHNSISLTKTIYQNGIEYMVHLTRSDNSAINPDKTHSNPISEASRLTLFNRQTLQQIPILNAMGISFTDYENGRLRVDMPLSPNINDKNTAFGGSIATLATISGWALPSLILNCEEWRYDVLIGEGSTRYHSPVVADCYAIVQLGEEEIRRLSIDLASNRKARLNISVDIFVDQTAKAASFSGTYHVRETRRGYQRTPALNE